MQPEIQYPCEWEYTVIGEGEEILLAHAEIVLAGLDHAKNVSKKSAAGRYTSIRITLIVRDETHRNALFEALKRHPSVRAVM